ncbi:WD40/YVTN/BNR-like repeat-containing protein [Pseudomonas sp. NFX98]|uniref:WD40/YVTN/BNR-like repeat-containing protein n=1 Tax=Pseudomonas sp. NFX98 TaxID=3399122 RepID=UPI0039FD6BE0
MMATSFCPAYAEYRDPLDSPSTISPLAARTQLLAVTRAGARLVAVGWRGHIVTSDDSGKTWQQVQSPVDADLTAVSFPTAKKGWIVGHGGVVLKTEDGGSTWTKQLDGRSAGEVMIRYYQRQIQNGNSEAEQCLEAVKLNTQNGPEHPWLDVIFSDEKHGYIVGTFNQIMQTEDGGATWVPIMEMIDNPQALHLNAITRQGDDYFIASEQGTVFHKGKNGARFTALTTGYSGTFFGVVADDKSIFAYGLRGTVYRSDDRGGSWQTVRTTIDTAITGGLILDNGKVLLVSQGAQLLQAKDHQAPFESIAVKKPALFTGITSVDDNTIVIVGTAGANLETIIQKP